MKECDYCQHVEMCAWRKDVEEQGCEFFDNGNKSVEDNINKVLDKIRAEIEAEMNDLYRQSSIDQRTLTIIHACQRHIAIIDEYTESEDKE